MEARILLVEDAVSDAELIKEAFQDSGINHQIDLVMDGEEALDLLRRLDKKPHIVILDLNLPKKSGLEVLKEIREDADISLRVTPVIILTNSRSQKDVLNAYAGGCNAYIRKPIGFDSIVEAIQRTGLFWFDCALVPENVRIPRIPSNLMDTRPPKNK